MATFTSTDQTITSGGTLTLAHGLGSLPKIVDYYLVCQTAEFGFSVGDVIRPVESASGSAPNNCGMSIKADATNLIIRFGSATSVFSTTRNDADALGNFNVISLTNSKWKVRFHARTAEATSFTTSDTTISSGKSTTIAHGLGTTPTFLSFALVCVTANNGYSAGDVVWPMNCGTSGSNTGVAVRPDATNLNIIWGTAGFNLLDATTGTHFLATSPNWKIRFYGGTGTTQTDRGIGSSGTFTSVNGSTSPLVLPALKCITAEQGYSVGDIVFPMDAAHTTPNFGCTIRRGTTGRYCTNASGVFAYHRRDTNTFSNATDANWNFRGCAF